MSDWREAKKEMNRAGRFGIGWTIVIVVLVLALGAATWGISVLVSGPKGQGDALMQKNSAENWTAAQARFEGNYAEIVATDQKVTLAREALAANPTDQTAQQTLTGTQNYCLSVVADYNADARSYLAEDFRAADLPAQIDPLNAATDCK